MPEPTPTIHIARHPTSGVTAEGSDAFAATLLERAGFIPQSSIRQSWYRLPYDMGEDYENEKATFAYEMLTAARYPVVIDPSLRLRNPGTATPPLVVTHDAYNQTLSALIDEIVHADEAVEVAVLLYGLADEKIGMLPALREVVEKAGFWVDGLGAPPLAERLRAANRALLDATVGIHHTADALLALPDDRQRRPVPQWLLRIQAAQARTSTGPAPSSPGSDEAEPSPPAAPQAPRRVR
ncbi:hypothetical protein F9278_27935 [Streptomyces phaeolivaceus]|uniref:Uncharacterized protein n=1 Tax=Streptomyces phaeolivaceus TaxID=2653200 RepID=A0A5P8K7Z3_9ACTN|nr:hypothetical protein [Streptomyces phaeolivaceus]QFQ99345.1 hypothetical protein F9278_27935 [Streptomyces phaeolivaceus]